jgi:hypothetical protein
MTNEDNLETNILPTDGDYEDRGATLSFGEHFYASLDSDACNQPQMEMDEAEARNDGTSTNTETETEIGLGM